MKICPVCQKQYADQQNFCSDDGTMLQVVESTPVSPAAPVQNSVPLTTQPVQIIQMAPAKSKSGLYIALGLIVSVLLVIGYFVWQTQQADKVEKEMTAQEEQAYAQEEKDREQRIKKAALDESSIKNALDASANGSLANYRGCAETKMNLYMQRYNKWIEWQDSIPTISQTQQNVNLAAQSTLNSCRKEEESLQTGVPSYDCNSTKVTSPTELKICVTPELAQLDVIYSNAVRSARFFTNDPDKFNLYIKTGMKNRNSCDDNIDCIANTYKSMTSTLNGQIEP